jgi:hypothetical protein
VRITPQVLRVVGQRHLAHQLGDPLVVGLLVLGAVRLQHLAHLETDPQRRVE